MINVLAVILGGGKGKRLRPLTSERTKPAVPIGGQYRLIDVPVTNCLASEIGKIVILTQFNSASLNRHISSTYKFDYFSDNFVEILAAEQSQDSSDWFQGTADAVRKNIKHIKSKTSQDDLILILSGDQLYKMDLRHLLASHVRSGADVSISCKYVSKDDAGGYGIMQREEGDKIARFVEKPDDSELKDLGDENGYLASMGIYVFNRSVLFEVLDKVKTHDFGKHIIPHCIGEYRTIAHKFSGYWEDIGTIKAFYNANLDAAAGKIDFNFNYVYTHPRFLSPPKISKAEINDAIVAGGSFVAGAKIKNSIIGLRSIIGDNVLVEDSIIMGADYYEHETRKQHDKVYETKLGIGDGTVIKKAIVDKNARIGKNVVIENKDGVEDFESELYWIRDGIVIIPKGTVIPDGTVI